MKLRIIKASAPDTYRTQESVGGWHTVGPIHESVAKARSWMVKYASELRARQRWNVGEVVDELEVEP